MTYNAELQEEYTERDKPEIVEKHRKPVCNGIEHKVSKARGIRTSHSRILAGAKPAEWLAKPTKWLASRNAGRGRVMPPKSTPTPETSQSARAQATFESQKGQWTTWYSMQWLGEQRVRGGALSKEGREDAAGAAGTAARGRGYATLRARWCGRRTQSCRRGWATGCSSFEGRGQWRRRRAGGDAWRGVNAAVDGRAEMTNPTALFVHAAGRSGPRMGGDAREGGVRA
ncbi:hypothetical protein DFH09DRAFT_1100624 [Mycena vulgaris]|nr:hypothetical protein DFH09DRAFT_1100624 [Mycena vulgaris]